MKLNNLLIFVDSRETTLEKELHALNLKHSPILGICDDAYSNKDDTFMITETKVFDWEDENINFYKITHMDWDLL